ncbi:hypothetical protein BBJ28_00017335 [Nothophytophthora sp. Chile5]|nr:hypothetical protein BBJ28_00017335 [Nothophytophthora sp. Chile5]
MAAGAFLEQVGAAGTSWMAQAVYSGVNCIDTPHIASLATVSSCEPASCTSVDVNNVTWAITTTCNLTDRFAFADELFGEFDYLVVEDYGGVDCDSLLRTTVLPTTGLCELSTLDGGYAIIAELFANGSATIAMYDNDVCDGAPYRDFALDNTAISNGECIHDYYKFYSSAGDSSSTFSSGSSGTSGDNGAVYFAIPTLTVGFLIAALVWWRRVRPKEPSDDSTHCEVGCEGYIPQPSTPKSTFISTGTGSSYQREERAQRSLSCMCDDDMIAMARIPREKVFVQRLICRGGHGEVYFGSFNGQQVAVKVLLPETRNVIKHVNDFLAEVKLMAALDHPRIVQFVGVAWDSLSDLCVLSEYMAGGDLRTLLDSYEAQRHPVGFDRGKATIALHVAHALTYLHSLAPSSVLHRDLKSKNILLSAELGAKLTDFGVSRERADHTMTGGVGTSRWMAPEVMMGERYDDKADMFSFGVVLSELDLHALPYSHVRGESESGRRMPETAILQLVALGQLRVSFSLAGPEAMAALGLACVAVDPADRPTAAEALYKLHTVLAQGL